MKTNLVLYTTLGCHLCEDAEKLLTQISTGYELTKIDIAEDDQLAELYGVRIPVIKNLDKGAELGWPFELEELNIFIKG